MNKKGVEEVYRKYGITKAELKRMFKAYSLYIEHEINNLDLNAPLFDKPYAYIVPGMGIFSLTKPYVAKNFKETGVVKPGDSQAIDYINGDI